MKGNEKWNFTDVSSLRENIERLCGNLYYKEVKNYNNKTGIANNILKIQ